MGETTLLRVELAYPIRSAMSRNGTQVHEARARALRRGYKAAAEMLARSAYNLTVKEGRPFALPAEGEIPVTYTFCPPPGGKEWDDDNAVSAMKWGRDGIAAALRVNDKRFITKAVRWGKRVPRGCVIVEIGHAE